MVLLTNVLIDKEIGFFLAGQQSNYLTEASSL